MISKTFFFMLTVVFSTPMLWGMESSSLQNTQEEHSFLPGEDQEIDPALFDYDIWQERSQVWEHIVSCNESNGIIENHLATLPLDAKMAIENNPLAQKVATPSLLNKLTGRVNTYSLDIVKQYLQVGSCCPLTVGGLNAALNSTSTVFFVINKLCLDAENYKNKIALIKKIVRSRDLLLSNAYSSELEKWREIVGESYASLFSMELQQLEDERLLSENKYNNINSIKNYMSPLFLINAVTRIVWESNELRGDVNTVGWMLQQLQHTNVPSSYGAWRQEAFYGEYAMPHNENT